MQCGAIIWMGCNSQHSAPILPSAQELLFALALWHRLPWTHQVSQVGLICNKGCCCPAFVHAPFGLQSVPSVQCCKAVLHCMHSHTWSLIFSNRGVFRTQATHLISDVPNPALCSALSVCVTYCHVTKCSASRLQQLHAWLQHMHCCKVCKLRTACL